MTEKQTNWTTDELTTPEGIPPVDVPPESPKLVEPEWSSAFVVGSLIQHGGWWARILNVGAFPDPEDPNGPDKWVVLIEPVREGGGRQRRVYRHVKRLHGKKAARRAVKAIVAKERRAS